MRSFWRKTAITLSTQKAFSAIYNALLIVIGIACMTVGICMSVPYNSQYKKLKKELESINASFPKCPKCGKELPQRNFEFCPFCGNPLK